MFDLNKKQEKKVRARFNASIIQKTDDLIIQFEELIASNFPCNFL